MTLYENMDAADLRAEYEDWTQRTLQWADDLANAIDAQDIVRAAFMAHAYRQARHQMKKVKRALTLGVA